MTSVLKNKDKKPSIRVGFRPNGKPFYRAIVDGKAVVRAKESDLQKFISSLPKPPKLWRVKPPKPERKTLTSLTIDRAKWGRNYLLDTNGLMCCLGFACKKLGVPPDRMTLKGLPENLEDEFQAILPTWLIKEGDYSDPHLAAGFNDEDLKGTVDIGPGRSVELRTEAQREDRIKRIFAKHGCAVRFIGKRPE